MRRVPLLLAPRVRPGLIALSLLGAVGALCAPAQAQVLLTQEEALRLAFPEPATVERRTAFLEDAQLAEVNRLAAPAAASTRTVVSYYVGLDGDAPIGVAWFDAHRVRTLQEVLMVVVDPAGFVSHIEVLGFAEPPEYMAPGGWLELFSGRRLERGTSTRGDIPIITGATLTAHATSAAVRRSLALQQVIDPLNDTGSERVAGDASELDGRP
jgi:hypothetical protein